MAYFMLFIIIIKYVLPCFFKETGQYIQYSSKKRRKMDEVARSGDTITCFSSRPAHEKQVLYFHCSKISQSNKTVHRFQYVAKVIQQITSLKTTILKRKATLSFPDLKREAAPDAADADEISPRQSERRQIDGINLFRREITVPDTGCSGLRNRSDLSRKNQFAVPLAEHLERKVFRVGNGKF